MGDYLISSNTADAARKVIKQNLWHFFLNRILHESRQSKHVDIVLFTIATANAKTL